MNKLFPVTEFKLESGAGNSGGKITLRRHYASRGSVILNPTVQDDFSPTVDSLSALLIIVELSTANYVAVIDNWTLYSICPNPVRSNVVIWNPYLGIPLYGFKNELTVNISVDPPYISYATEL